MHILISGSLNVKKLPASKEAKEQWPGKLMMYLMPLCYVVRRGQSLYQY